jgi:hypothetical protein
VAVLGWGAGSSCWRHATGAGDVSDRLGRPTTGRAASYP